MNDMKTDLLIYALLALGFIVWFYFNRKKEKRHLLSLKRVQEDISIFSTIIENYKKHYGHYPIIDKKSDRQSGSALFEVLVGLKTPWGDPYSPHAAEHNPVLINFAESLIGRRTINGEIVDPWDNPYNICIDTNNDGIVEIHRHYLEYEDGPLIEHYHVKIGASIAIWSNGPNQKDDLGLGDDIKSW